MKEFKERIYLYMEEISKEAIKEAINSDIYTGNIFENYISFLRAEFSKAKVYVDFKRITQEVKVQCEKIFKFILTKEIEQEIYPGKYIHFKQKEYTVGEVAEKAYSEILYTETPRQLKILNLIGPNIE